jgi:hypothetical protein
MDYFGEEPDGSSSIDNTIYIARSPVVHLRHKLHTEDGFDDLLILVQAGTDISLVTPHASPAPVRPLWITPRDSDPRF